jgi:hypothetical protein
MEQRSFGPKREEVAGDWSRVHNEELHNLYTSPNIVTVFTARRMRWAGHVARMGKMRNEYNIFAGKPERKSPFGRPRHKWEDNIRIYLREIGWEILNWMHLVQDRDQWRALMDTVMNFRVS